MADDAELRSILEVHIAPLGYEYDRIRQPALEYSADRVYLLRDTELDNVAYHEELEETLTDNGITVETRTIEHDVYEVLGEVTTIADSHQEDIVRVNVSSGSKLADIGAALACMATDASGYHVRPKTRNHEVSETPRTTGMELAEQLPSYPLETPTTDQIRTLNYIEQADTEMKTPNKSELIAFAEEAELSFLVGADPANEKAKFALLNNRIIDPLLADGYIEVESSGRTKRISMTSTGKNALRAFRHKLPE
jgi:hypothetical protein